MTAHAESWLVLADGTIFEGEPIGFPPPGGVATGEVVFNTVMSGYQEVISDPSYAGQIITFTYPHIGNYGVHTLDYESLRPQCSGVIIREPAPRPSSWRAEESLQNFLYGSEIPAIAAIDTRRLTRHIRSHGSMAAAFGSAPIEALAAAARAEPGTQGRDLVSTVTCDRPFWVRAVSTGGFAAVSSVRRVRTEIREDRPYVVAYDFGIKTTILRYLAQWADVEVVPASTPGHDVVARRPDGVFLSNGPGDPEPLEFAISSVRTILDAQPSIAVFGICLGHQLLALALGAKTFKLPFGHHGGNHPVGRDSNTAALDGRPATAVEITSQNHNYAVQADSLDPSVARVTHTNLNDQTIEGLECLDKPAFSVQYHPEAGPGPHDSRYLFDRFKNMVIDRASSLSSGATRA